MGGNRGPVHRPTEKDRKEVETMAMVGMTDELIGRIKGVEGRTIRNHYREELHKGRAGGLGTLLQTAHRLAINGNIPMLIFLLKTRAGLLERIKHVDANGDPIQPTNVNVNISGQKSVMRLPNMMDPEEWKRVAAEHQSNILAQSQAARSTSR